jgi:hypothetical protein
MNTKKIKLSNNHKTKKMEKFIGFYYVSEENVSTENFNQKIDYAINHIKKSNDLYDNSIKLIRHSFNQGYTIQGHHFTGQYLTFEISKAGEINRQLNCFIDNNNKYMEVISI